MALAGSITVLVKAVNKRGVNWIRSTLYSLCLPSEQASCTTGSGKGGAREQAKLERMHHPV